MTQNQIAYQQLQEGKRHNRVSEATDIASTAINPIVSLINKVVPLSKFIVSGGNSGKRER